MTPSNPVDPNKINWMELYNSSFASRRTPTDGPPMVYDSKDLISGGTVNGLKVAISLLPLSKERKDDIFGFEGSIDPKDPFLSWEFVKGEGDRVLKEMQEKEEIRSDESLLGLWKDCVVEINYRKVARVLRLCRLDREKISIWRWWLGVQVVPDQEVGEEKGEIEELETSAEKEVAGPNEQLLDELDPRNWNKTDRRPRSEDVFALIEGRLDALLQLFEFQTMRVYLLELILSLHPTSHKDHHYKNYDHSSVHEPETLSPELRKFDFYQDVVRLMKQYQGDLGDASAVAKEGKGEVVEGIDRKGRRRDRSLGIAGKSVKEVKQERRVNEDQMIKARDFELDSSNHKE